MLLIKEACIRASIKRLYPALRIDVMRLSKNLQLFAAQYLFRVILNQDIKH